MPSLSSEMTLATCCFRVSAILTETVQHIHSLRANGVRLSQSANAFGSDTRAFRKSAGNSCTTPLETMCFVMSIVYHPVRVQLTAKHLMELRCLRVLLLHFHLQNGTAAE